jgi:adenosylcobyric acid synthase
MLGERITNADIEGTGDREVVEGFGLLPVTTRFSTEKTVEHVERELRGVGPLAGVADESSDGERVPVEGYEIHMGDSTLRGDTPRPFTADGAATDRVLGTYLHDLFATELARNPFARNTSEMAGKQLPALDSDETVDPYEAAAALLDNHADLSPIDALRPFVSE